MTKKNDKKVENKIEVRLEPLNHKTITLTVIGKTPLVVDTYPEEVRKSVWEKQAGATKSGKKKVRDIDNEIKLAEHIISKGKVGFPAAGFKKGMMNVTSRVGDKFFSKALVCGAVRIINAENGLIPIDFKKKTIWEHAIGAQTKFSPSYHDWNCELTIQYDANNISASDIVTLINYAGFYVGLGMDRPKGRDGGSGEHGMYEVQTN